MQLLLRNSGDEIILKPKEAELGGGDINDTDGVVEDVSGRWAVGNWG